MHSDPKRVRVCRPRRRRQLQDGDNCTQNDRCLNEVCVGDELVCEGSADGCLLGQCNRDNGTCETVPADFGPCDDGDAFP